MLDTAEMDEVEPVEVKPGETVTVQGRSIVVLHGPARRGRRRTERPGGDGEVPAATYRLQVHAGFRLDDAAEVAGYLADLGVTHAYSSPLLRSAEGSTHGYDTVDHAHIDEARGGRAGFDRFVAALHEHGLGLVLDLVPNHMGVDDPAAAPWWWDVLQHGQGQRPRRGLRHRLGVRRRQGPHPGAGLGGRRREARGAWTASCATTTTASRSRPGTGERRRRRRCTPASTTSWSTGAAPTPT